VTQQLPPVPPGEVLRTEFMAPHGLTARALARDLGAAEPGDEDPERGAGGDGGDGAVAGAAGGPSEAGPGGQDRSWSARLVGGVTMKSEKRTSSPARSGVQHIGPTR
jgi:hypothetical protein